MYAHYAVQTGCFCALVVDDCDEVVVNGDDFGGSEPSLFVPPVVDKVAYLNIWQFSHVCAQHFLKAHLCALRSVLLKCDDGGPVFVAGKAGGLRAYSSSYEEASFPPLLMFLPYVASARTSATVAFLLAARILLK